ncbi:uncharacterized protein E0L32_007013 [Thyridium curvatum]|uniref:Tyrosinase copper-binding domain-containing protein n=1 Tax=Thyridium curvatum TaxID=1093900 RepID=A0A507AZW4_9PEZI|nr:uncharacterized protein E0L32_007013 [Thyridium curvatum]TPX12366.1 hypothetical protein E0L32_007013 [Thyridium curvatum]
MRLASVSVALYGAASVSALTLPWPRAGKLVDLSIFGGRFETLKPEEAKTHKSGAPNTISPPENKNKATAAGADGAAAGGCENPSLRPEWRQMDDAGRQGYIDAVKCLMGRPSAGGDFPGSQNRYEDLVSLHQQLTGSIHMVGQFLPFHRYYVHVFESLLRDECGYGGPMPWWDETLDAGNFGNSPVLSAQWFGTAPPLVNGQGACVSDGAFAGLTLHIGPGGGQSDHCLARALDESQTAQCNREFVDSCNSHDNYADMESCAEMGPHAYGHNGIGAVMQDVSPSPGDPVFFLHHGFVDRNWRAWQNADPANRLYQIGGYSNTQDPKQPLTLDYVLTSKGIRPDVRVNEVMDTKGAYLCYDYL